MPRLPTLLNGIQNKIRRAANPQEIYDTLTQLQEFGKVSGIGQAAALYSAKGILAGQAPTSEEGEAYFEELIFANVGYAPETIRRYLLAWEFMEDIEPRINEGLWELYLNRPVSDLIALGQTTKEHGPLSHQALQEIAKSEDTVSLRKRIRKAIGEKESENNALTYRLQPDGTLEAWQYDKMEILGFINPEPGPIRDKARARLIRRNQFREV